MRRAARTDDNHSEIMAALRATGAYVVDCSRVGDGFPDALVFFRGHCIPVEIKDSAKPPSRRKLTPDQVVFHAEAKARGVEVRVVTNENEALAVVGARIAA